MRLNNLHNLKYNELYFNLINFTVCLKTIFQEMTLFIENTLQAYLKWQDLLNQSLANITNNHPQKTCILESSLITTDLLSQW